MKERYLLDIKKAMFFHFGSGEIKSVMEDANSYFESALDCGVAEEEIIREYGAPREIADNLRLSRNPVEQKRKNAVKRKFLLLTCCLLCAVILLLQMPLHISLNLFIIFCSVFVWFFSGNDCTVHVLAQTKKQKEIFVKCQMYVFVLYLLLQTAALFIIPNVAGSYSHLKNMYFLGEYLEIFLCGVEIVSGISIIAFYYLMQKGNLYLFFPLIQFIAILCGVFEYRQLLRNMESVQKSGENLQYLFVPYLVSLAVLSIYWLFIKRKEKK